MTDDNGKRKLRDEVASLAEMVSELRAELAQQRLAAAMHHCHGCHCQPIWVYQPLQPYINTPYIVTCGATTTTAAPNISGTWDSVTTSALTS